MKKLITAIGQRIDKGHVSIHTLRDTDASETYNAHTLDELVEHMRVIFGPMFEETEEVVTGALSLDEIKSLLDKKEH